MFRLEVLAELAEKNRLALQSRVHEFSLAGRVFQFNSRPAVMGVVNLSADSWYRESVSLTAESAIQRGRVLAAQGADLVDIGAESTLAQAARVDDTAQTQRLLPVIKYLRANDVLVSAETYQTSVARACLEAGANVLNLTGANPEDELLRLVARHEAAVIFCYVQGRNVREVGDFDFSADPITAMHDYFARQVDRAIRLGVTRIFI